jgi:hypothetical protein
MLTYADVWYYHQHLFGHLYLKAKLKDRRARGLIQII